MLMTDDVHESDFYAMHCTFTFSLISTLQKPGNRSVKGKFMNNKNLLGEGVTFIKLIFMPPNLIWFWDLTFACLCVPSALAGLLTGMTLLEEKSENFLWHGACAMTTFMGNPKILLPSLPYHLPALAQGALGGWAARH